MAGDTVRTLGLNKQTMYYALYNGMSEVKDSDGKYTGAKTATYGEITQYDANAAPSANNEVVGAFGTFTDYSRVAVVDADCPIVENAKIWLGISTTLAANYTVKRVASSINGKLLALQEIR